MIDDVGVAIEHTGQGFAVAHRTGNEFQRVGRGEHVAGIQKHDVVALGHADAFVHGIIEAAIGLGDDDQLMICLFFLRLFLVGTHKLHRGIARCSVDDQMLHMVIGLRQHAIECAPDHRCSIKRASDDGKPYHNLNCFEAIAS